MNTARRRAHARHGARFSRPQRAAAAGTIPPPAASPPLDRPLPVKTGPAWPAAGGWRRVWYGRRAAEAAAVRPGPTAPGQPPGPVRSSWLEGGCGGAAEPKASKGLGPSFLAAAVCAGAGRACVPVRFSEGEGTLIFLSLSVTAPSPRASPPPPSPLSLSLSLSFSLFLSRSISLQRRQGLVRDPVRDER